MKKRESIIWNNEKETWSWTDKKTEKSNAKHVYDLPKKHHYKEDKNQEDRTENKKKTYLIYEQHIGSEEWTKSNTNK